MISQWQVRNFKSISHKMSNLQFAPITLFAGANSSGKSSVIQSILMMMQTMASSRHGTLQLNGELLTLGTPTDVWHNGVLYAENRSILGGPSDKKPIFLHFALQIDDGDASLEINFDFEAYDNSKIVIRNASYRIQTSDSDFKLVIKLKDGIYYVHEIDRDTQQSIEADLQNHFIELKAPISDSAVEVDGLFPDTIGLQAIRLNEGINWATALFNPFNQQIPPESFSREIPDRHRKTLKQLAKKLGLPNVYEVTQHNKERMIIRTLGDYQDWFGSLPTRSTSELQEYLYRELEGMRVEELVPYRIDFIDHIRQRFQRLLLQNVRYLSANRIPPTILFSPGNDSQWSEVGTNGENVAAALYEHGSRSIIWYDPIELKKKESALVEAVATWLKRFGIIDDLHADQQGKLGTSLTIRVSGVDRELDLTAVGFGTSQILPIIVQGLLTPPGGIFIVEQPEVHLHPSVQAQLALFFVALTRANVQCIIETHSEHLVNQLRLFIADRQLNIQDQIKMFFAEREPRNGTYFSEVEINKKGEIQNWPRGFMDESNRQAKEMLRAILRD